MPHMTFDWLTTGMLRPMLARHSLRLADLAASLHQAVAGTYSPVENKDLGRTLGLAEFKTAHRRPGDRLIDLSAPGWDPFRSPADYKPFPKLPEMWGGVTRDDDEYRLHLAGMAIHPSLIALPTAGGGMILFRAVLPETLTASMTGQLLSSMVSHPSIDHLDLVVRRLRPAAREELSHLDNATAAVVGSQAMVATFRNDKTAYRVAYDV